jgi:hypothetical protein
LPRAGGGYKYTKIICKNKVFTVYDYVSMLKSLSLPKDIFTCIIAKVASLHATEAFGGGVEEVQILLILDLSSRRK